MLRKIGIGCGGLIALVVLLAVMGNLASGGKAPPDSSPAASIDRVVPTAVVPASPTTDPLSACFGPSQSLIKDLAEALTVNGGGTLTKVKALPVQVSDADKATWYLVGAEIQGAGMSGTIAVWVTTVNPKNEANTGGIVYSVDALAKEFSDWPRPAAVSDRFPATDPDIALVRRCVQSSSKP